MEYIALGFSRRQQNLVVGLGLNPVLPWDTALDTESIDENGDLVTNSFSGEGGLNQVFLSLGMEILPNLAPGCHRKIQFW